MTCPCCGHHSVHEPFGYDLCWICFWEDDPHELRWPDWDGGANSKTLIESQQTYAEIGAMDEVFLGKVRQPTEAEPLDDEWRPIDPTRDKFEPSGVKLHLGPDDYTHFYWWRETFWRPRERPATFTDSKGRGGRDHRRPRRPRSER